MSSSFETISFTTDKKNYVYTDTLFMSGMLFAADVIMPSALSQYAIVDVTNDKGDVVAIKKVRIQDSFLNCRIPLSELGESDFFVVRSYTEFMRNFPESTWPRMVVGVNNQQKIPVIVDDKNLYVAEEVTTESSLIATIDQKEYYTNDTILLELKNMHGRNLHLNLRMEKKQKPRASFTQGAIRRFRTLGKETVWRISQGKYALQFFPENSLSIGGRVKTERGKVYKNGGYVVAFNHENGSAYTGNIDIEGQFRFVIDDFKDGDVFFLQAYNKKGKSYYYDIDIPDMSFPSVDLPTIQWIDRVDLTNDYTFINLDTTRIHWIPEINIEARLKKDDFYSPKYYKNNYFEYEDIQKRNYVDLEHIIDAMPGIAIGRMEMEGEESLENTSLLNNKLGPRMILSLRGSGVLKEPAVVGVKIDNVWTAEEKDFDLIKNEINVQDISTIEYIPAVRAYGLHGVRAYYGVLLITTKNGDYKERIRSRGVRYQPLGLSDNRPFMENIALRNVKLTPNDKCQIKFMAPFYAGDYKIVIEGIGNRKVIYEEVDVKILP